MAPLAIDLFCGLGGWTEGLLAEGYYVVGFDIERHQYWMPDDGAIESSGMKGTNPVAKRGWTQGCAISLGMEGASARPRTKLVEYPAQLVLQSVLTLHGSQFKDAALIVASPPCQEFSYMAMPWSRAKAKQADIEADTTGEKRAKLTALFDACFRIQREAIEAAGHFIPLVVENVRGANKWVGRSRWNYGSFHLWGDVPALMPMTKSCLKMGDAAVEVNGRGQSASFARLGQIRADLAGVKSGQKLPGFRFDGSGKSFQSASVERGQKFPVGNCSEQRWVDQPIKRLQDIPHGSPGQKVAGQNPRDAAAHDLSGVKGFTPNGEPMGKNVLGRMHGSKSPARKAASAQIAKIPLPLARHIARYWYPNTQENGHGSAPLSASRNSGRGAVTSSAGPAAS